MKQHLIPISGFCLALAGTAFSQKVIPNHAIANRVLGQSNFVTGTAPLAYSSTSFDLPSSVAIDFNTGKVFVSDLDGDRILRFASATSLANGAPAEAVFGQNNFNSGDSASTRTGVNDPEGMFIDRLGRLWVADEFNHRVLLFEAASFRANGTEADRVFGQPDFTTATSGVAQNKMNSPVAVWVDAADRLWVADRGNNRVLRFDSVSNKNPGANADAVLGQTDFVTATAGSGATGMQNPHGIAVSPTGSLFVSCANAHRILRFDNAATLANGAQATRVLGQLDFTGTSSGLSATALNSPAGLTITSNDDLWVADRGNDRLVRFGKASTLLSGAAANGVVGQPDLATKLAVPDSARTLDLLTSATTTAQVDSVGNLWTADTVNNRVLRFPPDVIKPKLALTGIVPKTTTKASELIKGTANDLYGISKVQYRINNGPPKNATGTTNWQFNAALKAGANTITITAIDSVGNTSLPKVVKITRGAAASLAAR